MAAQWVDLEMPRPGVWGVNSSASGDVMPKQFATECHNMVLNEAGYMEARRGSKRRHADTLQSIIASVGAQTVRQIFTTTDENDTPLTIFSTEEAIFKIDATTVTNITGTMTTPTAGNWKFVNLNNQIIGIQKNHIACIMTTPSTGTFANITFTGTEAPINGVGTTTIQDAIGAFGRLWIIQGDELRYSSLLAPTDFDPTGGDAGAFTLNSVFLGGKDSATALAEFNGNLIVFAQENIVVYNNPWNPNGTGAGYGGGYGGASTDPAMGVVESLGGVGCIARDTIQYTQNDLLFLSDQGITSLGRVVQEKSMPLTRYTDNMRREVLDMIRGNQDPATFFSAYLEGNGMYIFGCTDGCVFCIDTTTPLPDGTYRMTSWDKNVTTMATVPQEELTASNDTWGALLLADEAQYISRAEGFLDHVTVAGLGGDTFIFRYVSGWTPFHEELQNVLKIPKRIAVVLKGNRSQDFFVNIAYDYAGFVESSRKSATAELSDPKLYGVHTYGGTTVDDTTCYYGVGVGITEQPVMGFGSGRIMKVKIESTVNGNNVSLQQFSINAKLGKKH